MPTFHDVSSRQATTRRRADYHARVRNTAQAATTKNCTNHTQYGGVPVSEGAVAAMTRRAADRLDGFCDQVAERIAESEVAGFDETGLRVAGSLQWAHCARADKCTLITCHPKRGTKGIDAADALGRFRGVAAHDAWAPYDTYLNATRQLCCAHALRELQAVSDAAPEDAQWCWATQATAALVAMRKLVTEAIGAGADAVEADALGRQVRRYRSAVQIGITQTAARSSEMMKKHHALARRLREVHPERWTGAYTVQAATGSDFS